MGGCGRGGMLFIFLWSKEVGLVFELRKDGSCSIRTIALFHFPIFTVLMGNILFLALLKSRKCSKVRKA